MKTTKFHFANTIIRATLIWIIVLCAMTGGRTAGYTAIAQQKRPTGKIDNLPISEVVKVRDENRVSNYTCQQQINDLTILQRQAGRYEFQFRTTCPTQVTIEFSDQPPVSLNPQSFKKAPYNPNKPLIPTITTGLIGERTQHDLYANLGGDKKVDYYIITVQDALGNSIYKTGSLALDSVRPILTRAKRYPG